MSEYKIPAIAGFLYLYLRVTVLANRVFTYQSMRGYTYIDSPNSEKRSTRQFSAVSISARKL